VRPIFIALALWASTGCYHYRASVPAAPATEPKSATLWSYAWGAVQQNIQPENCVANSLQEVTVSSNFGYTLLAVVTLGFVQPAQVEWRCGKETPNPDEDI
jgi:hypothetical protein